MPTISCEKDGKKGYKYGESGKCYIGKGAKRKAILQGAAIAQNSGEKLKLSKEELEVMEEVKKWTYEEAIQWLTDNNLIADLFEENKRGYVFYQTDKSNYDKMRDLQYEYTDIGIRLEYVIDKENIIIICVQFDAGELKIVKMKEVMIKQDEHNCIFGWAYARETKDGKQVVDHSGEFVKAENFKDLELATYAYNLSYRQADRQHDCIAKGYLIESIVFTKEKMAKMGIPEGVVPEAVWMGFFFPDDNDYQEIKRMSHPMFSLYGKVTKELVEEVE